MPNIEPIQTAFNNGELTPRLHGHVDFAKFASSLDRLENMVVQRHGPAFRRSGSRFVAKSKQAFPDKPPRFVEFEFNAEDAYQLEFGELYVRFFLDQGVVESAPGVPYELVSPYTMDEVEELDWTQSADTLYIAHKDHVPRKLVRNNLLDWEFVDVDWIGPFGKPNKEPSVVITVDVSAVGQTGIATMQQPSGPGNGLFTANDVGRKILLGEGDTTNIGGVLEITGFIDVDNVNVLVTRECFEVNNVPGWRLSEWGGSRGFPSVVTIHQQRTVWANSPEQPQFLWFSSSGDFENFDPINVANDVGDDNAITYELGTDQVNAIRWLKSTRVLMVGTVGAEFKITGDANGTLTPDATTADRESQYGSAAGVRPIFAGNEVIFLQRANRKLRALTFDFATDGYNAPDITLFGEHLTIGGVVDMSYQQEPDSIIWSVRSDGLLLGFTYDRAQQVQAWHRHPLGGTNTKVKRVSVIPSVSKQQDETWLCVQRDHDAGTEYDIEFFETYFDHDTLQEDAFFVDSGLTYDGAPVTTITGIPHEGETVQVLVDGATHPDQVVVGGEIELISEASKVHVGLGFKSVMRSLKVGRGLGTGTTIGLRQRIHSVLIDFYRSLGAKYGRANQATIPVPARKTDDLMDTAPPLGTGLEELTFPASWTRDAQYEIVQELPLPLNVRAAIPRLDVNDS